MLLLIYLLLGLSGSSLSLNATEVSSSSKVCGTIDDTLFINSMSDLVLVSHCETLNTSLFISGGYDITSLEELSNTRYIKGYLVIIDTHLLRDLYGLHNIEYINGEVVYSNNNSVVIRHNNLPSNTDIGLCYVDTIDWSLLTNKNIWIDNNGNVCSSCDIECVGCWGPGSQLCQTCVNFRSGHTCVSECYIGTIEDGNVCIEKYPSKVLLDGNAISSSSIILSFNVYSVGNGVTLGYSLLMDGMLYDSYILDRDASNMFLTNNYTYYGINNVLYNIVINSLDIYREYNFSIRLLNSIGYGNYSDIIRVRTLAGVPPVPNTPVVTLVDKTVYISIEIVSNVNGEIILYRVLDNRNNVVYSGIYTSQVIVNNLLFNTNYSYLMEAYTTSILKSVSNYSNSIIIIDNNSNKDSSSSDNTLLYIIIGSSVGGFLLIVLLCLCIMRRRNNNNMARNNNNSVNIDSNNRIDDNIYTSSYTNPAYLNPNLYDDLNNNIINDRDPDYLRVYDTIDNVGKINKEQLSSLPPLRPKNMMRE